jgi:D-beta-D-heptose 7-phosphate kinase/D-beta-D-heptose 1-phosphate adenosyltransferase
MKKILTIGDQIIDRYIYCHINRVSPEAACLIGLFDGKMKEYPGGAHNVDNNLKHLCISKEIRTEYFPTSLSIKTRYVDYDSRQQVFRLDHDSIEQYDSLEPLYFEECNFDYDAVVVSDYCKSKNIETTAKRACKSVKDFFFVNSKTKNPNKFLDHGRQCKAFFFCNKSEWKTLQENDYVSEYDYSIVTLGKDGIMVFDRQGECLLHSKPKPVSVYNVTGAGDTVISTFAWFVTKFGFSIDNLKKAIVLSNHAATKVIQKQDTTPIKFTDIKEFMLKSKSNGA